MAEKQVGEIRISKRIVRIGHQVYPLANIARVQTLRVIWGGKYATFYPLREIIVLLLILGALIGLTDVVLPELAFSVGFDIDAALGLANFAAILVGIRMAYLLCVLVYRLLIRRPSYALVIETAGTQSTALSGTDLDEIHRVEGEIVDAIEDPPAYERVVHVGGDLVIGDKVGRDQYHLSGTDNKMSFNR